MLWKEGGGAQYLKKLNKDRGGRLVFSLSFLNLQTNIFGASNLCPIDFYKCPTQLFFTRTLRPTSLEKLFAALLRY